MSVGSGTLADLNSPEQRRRFRALTWRRYLSRDLARHIFRVHNITLLGFDLTPLQDIHRTEWPTCGGKW